MSDSSKTKHSALRVAELQEQEFHCMRKRKSPAIQSSSGMSRPSAPQSRDHTIPALTLTKCAEPATFPVDDSSESAGCSMSKSTTCLLISTVVLIVLLRRASDHVAIKSSGHAWLRLKLANNTRIARGDCLCIERMRGSHLTFLAGSGKRSPL